MYIVKGSALSLLGRGWLRKLTLDWKKIGMSAPGVDSLRKTHAKICKDGLGTLKSIKTDLHVKPEAQPKFHKLRPVPFSLKEAVGSELDKLEEEGVLKKVAHAELAAPIVSVPKGEE